MHHAPLSVLLILGIGAFGGLLGAWLFQRLRIPQVVGYIAIGLLIGRSGLNLVSPAHVESLKSFNLFALGIIGFLVGGELKSQIFRQYGKQFTGILLGEGLLAFGLVAVPSTLIIYLVSGNLPVSLAAGIVFGAIASATDPASTMDVIWEYRSLGKLTTAIIATVALDDALAMTLYGLGKSAAELLVVGDANILGEMLKIARELGGAVVVGAALGFLLTYLLRYTHQREKSLAISIGTVLLAIGLAVTFDLDLILTTMTLGVVLTNYSPRRAHELFDLVRTVSIPVYVLFFVLVGARLHVGNLPGWLWLVVIVYVVGRNLGKVVGTYLGARATGAAPVVQKYCGMAIFAQGGVAVGLSIMASQSLEHIQVAEGLSMGEAIVFAVTATTLIAQIIGPPMVKWAIHLAGEAGRNLTEEDVATTMTVADVAIPVTPIREATPVAAAVETMSGSAAFMQPVTDAAGKLVGMLSFENLREILPERDTWAWLLVADVMGPCTESVVPDMRLAAAVRLMGDTGVDELLVVDSAASAPVGVIDRRAVNRAIRQKLLHARKDG